MTPEERSRLETLDTILSSDEVHAQIRPVVERVRQELARNKNDQMAWEPIPLATFGGALPSAIRSSWVFIIRAGAVTGAERHPNSHQRMMSFQGRGDLQTEAERRSEVGGQRSEIRSRTSKQTPVQRRTPTEVASRQSNAEPKDGMAGANPQWESNVLVSGRDAPLEQRWISIPDNVWHQVVVPDDDDWVVVSFHTVPAEELIEERPAAGDAGGTKQMRYAAKAESGKRKAES